MIPVSETVEFSSALLVPTPEELVLFSGGNSSQEEITLRGNYLESRQETMEAPRLANTMEATLEHAGRRYKVLANHRAR